MTPSPASNRRRFRRDSNRSGIATVEFAIVLPVLFVLTLGTIDVCSVMFLKESAVLAAYEGARQGVARGRTNANVTTRVREFLDERNIQYQSGSVCTFSSPGFESAETLENVTVTVNIPAAGNLLIPTERFAELIVTASVTMRKEYENLTNN
ncbi:TadE-like protein [Rubripirellula lacrimiformis]|uniref:TadE-like protein n=1 Tax=Rubripirellula lacrimiformis TaxID=1930273 RepID=A0A517NHQ1_9BACT|nr:TadE/TadG family type IV pilus assembly protein [Rubripirellula lacrimiformis]QDT06666.1 TadE-like protein [Rubripirellula lacrimiformis]